MRKLAGAALALGLMSASAASAQYYQPDTGPNSNWQFESASDKIAKQGDLNLMLLKKHGYYDIFNKDGGSSAGGGGSSSGSGLASSGVTGTQMIVQQNISCSAASGANLVCSGGDMTTSGTLTNSGNSMSSSNTLTGNTVRNTTSGNNIAGTVNGNQ